VARELVPIGVIGLALLGGLMWMPEKPAPITTASKC
jgi:hypothetical protein